MAKYEVENLMLKKFSIQSFFFENIIGANNKKKTQNLLLRKKKGTEKLI